MKGVIYHIATGVIDGVVFAANSEELAKQASESRGTGVIEIDTQPDGLFKDYYVLSGSLELKQHFTIDAIPLPATAEIEGEQYAVTENPAVFEFDTPGTYTVRVDAGPAYYVEEFTVDYSA